MAEAACFIIGLVPFIVAVTHESVVYIVQKLNIFTLMEFEIVHQCSQVVLNYSCCGVAVVMLGLNWHVCSTPGST